MGGFASLLLDDVIVTSSIDDVIVTSSMPLLLSLPCVEFNICCNELLTSRLPALIDDVMMGVAVERDLRSTVMTGEGDDVIMVVGVV
jgi:hypothetical protein